MSRPINFSAGPAALPLPVLQRVRNELIDYEGTGCSVMEMSHRSEDFLAIAAKSEQSLRQIYGLGEEFEVLFLQGGATLQFAMIPLNTGLRSTPAGYVDTGLWSRKAIAEARRVGPVAVLASGTDAVADCDSWSRCTDLLYVHAVANETIDGIQFPELPSVTSAPLCLDLSSEFLTRCCGLDGVDLVYAGAQKNAGPAGLTLVILRREFLEMMSDSLPAILSYRSHARSHSMLNTPPTFSWYVAGLVFDWVLEQGGLVEMERRCAIKSKILYDVIDASDFYQNDVPPFCRSRVNVPFRLGDGSLDRRFLTNAAHNGLLNLKGHRSVGGMRASMYNAIAEADARQLVDFMQDFERSA